MTSNVSPLRVDWGEWVLGDLPGVLARVAGLLGPSVSVLRVLVEFPVSWAVPVVEVHTVTGDEVDDLYDRVQASGEPVQVVEVNAGASWVGRLAGVELVVMVAEDGPVR